MIGVQNPARLWHKHGACKQARTPTRRVRPLDAAAFERLALGYVGRLRDQPRQARATIFDASSPSAAGRARASRRSRRIVERFAELGYVDDRAFAEAAGRALSARGYGARRLDGALGASASRAADAAAALARRPMTTPGQTALRFAQRRRIGPFADRPLDQKSRSRRAFAAMMRAGHRDRCHAADHRMRARGSSQTKTK